MSRTPLIAGNWKLHKTIAEARTLAAGLKDAPSKHVEVLVAPVAAALHAVVETLAGSGVFVAGQNCHSENQGAYTGELSPLLLADAGCTHCIVGHSERRQIFGETDAGVNRKAHTLLEVGLTPIVCVGETLAQREAGETLAVVKSQMDGALAGLDVAKLILAYEPVWAIGTGKTASPADAQAVHAAMRGWLAEAHGEVAQSVRILYGGSVKPANAADLLAETDIDGALVGGASLDPDTFLPIVHAAHKS